MLVHDLEKGNPDSIIETVLVTTSDGHLGGNPYRGGAERELTKKKGKRSPLPLT